VSDPSTQTQHDGYPIKYWFLLAFLALIWGSSFILIKKGLQVFSPEEVGALRVVGAFVCLLPFAIAYLSKIPKHRFKYLLLMGTLGNFIPSFLFAVAQTELASSLTGVMNSMTPLMTMLVGLVFFQGRLSRQQLVGLLIAFFGSFIISISSGEGGFGDFNVYVFFVVGAVTCYAFSTNIIHSFLNGYKPLAVTSIAISMVGPPALVYLFFGTRFIDKFDQGAAAWYAMGYIVLLGIMGTAFALVIFNKVVQRTSAVFATSVTYLIPIVAVFWGVLDGETLYAYHYIAFTAIMLGVFVANARRKAKPVPKAQ